MSVQAHRPTNSFYVIARSLLPSSLSLMVTFLLSGLIVGGHILSITLNGKALPSTLNEYAIQDYTTTVIDPLLRVTNNVTFNNGLSILMWALFGWLLYAIVAFIANNLSEIRTAKQEIRFVEGYPVYSPMHRSIIGRLLWRLCVIVLLVVGTFFATDAMHYSLMNDYRFLLATSVPEMLPYLLINLAIWMGLLHGYVVLLRLYLLRTRVFGEILF